MFLLPVPTHIKFQAPTGAAKVIFLSDVLAISQSAFTRSRGIHCRWKVTRRVVRGYGSGTHVAGAGASG